MTKVNVTVGGPMVVCAAVILTATLIGGAPAAAQSAGDRPVVAGSPPLVHADSAGPVSDSVALAVASVTATAPEAKEASTAEATESGAQTGAASSSGSRNGWQASIGAGWSARQIVHETSNPNTFLTFKKGGIAVNAALGYRFQDVTLEGEMSYMTDSINEAGAGTPFGNFQSAAVGSVTLHAYMVNVFYDIPAGSVKPYVSGGVGFYQSVINGLLPDFFNTLGIGTTGVNASSDTPFAFQLRAGIGYALGARSTFFAGYRYFNGRKLNFAALPFGVFVPDGAKIHSIEAGFRVGI